MNPIQCLATAAAISAPTPAPVDDPEPNIVVTASREPVEAQRSVMPVTSVRQEVVRPGPYLPIAADVLRALPGVSVSVSGQRGSQTQVRIRGAEANHSLLFVDGIRFNDPAAGNEARFELLTTDGLSRIDIVRGPQSALWGSEAIGGVIAAYTQEAQPGPALEAIAEYGSQGSSRLSATASTTTGDLTLSATATRLESDGFDSFDGTGDRDGFSNRSANVKAIFRPRDALEIGAIAHWVEGTSDYDGLDPVTFRRADTQDSTRNRIGALRGYAEAESGSWSGKVEATLLASTNRNLLAGSPLNRTSGRRMTIGGQVSREHGDHRATIAAEHQREEFRAEDQNNFGATDQDRSRALHAGLIEWEAAWQPWLTTNLVLRHDSFSAFRDATTIRAGVTVLTGRNISLTGSYGEGIAQPSFYDLFGFFPGSFVGNPALGPERSVEWQAGIRRAGRLSLGLSAFTARLRDEIVDVFDTAASRWTTRNATGASRRRGIEAEAEWRLPGSGGIGLNYTWLDAEERQVAGGLPVREIRRPRHSASMFGYRSFGPVQLSARIAYVGSRRDTDFDSFPARAVTLDDYLLTSASLDWRISDMFEAYVRAENAFDAQYQDVVGYRTAGRTVHAGIRLRLGD